MSILSSKGRIHSLSDDIATLLQGQRVEDVVFIDYLVIWFYAAACLENPSALLGVMSVCFWQKESLILTSTVGSLISTPRSPVPGL